MIAPDSALAALRQALERAEAENQRLQFIIKLQEEKIRWFNLKLWGPKGEKLSANQTLLLLEEASVTTQEVAQEAELPQEQTEQPLPRARQTRPQHPGREKLPEHLERREEIIPCCPQDCRCPQCGAERPIIGYETRDELACEPARFFVRVIKREKRGSHCLDEQGVVTAPVPPQIVPKSKLSNDFIIEVLARKYQQHLPVYRQCAVLAEDHGIELSRKTLTGAILAAGGWLSAVVAAQAHQLLAGRICRPTKRRCRFRPTPKPAAIIRLTCGSTGCRAVRWCLIFGWAGGGKGRGSFCKAFEASCNVTVTTRTTNWEKALFT